MSSSYKLAETTWDEKELEAIHKVIETGHFSMGPFVEEFEEKFAKYIGSKYCVMVSSGSAANLLATAALFYRKNKALKRGDEVIVPAVSWSTTYFPLYQYGLKLKFVDIDINTLNYDLEQLEGAVSENTRMIVAVNLLGNPNDFNEINRIIGDKNIVLIEDNCESLGAKFNDKFAGTFGLMGTFSTFFSHHMATMEGGLLVTDDEELYHICLSLRAHGWTRNLPKDNLVTQKSDNTFEESFRFVLPGYNLRPVEMSGAIGTVQLEKLDSFISMRRKNAAKFMKLFKDNKDFIIQSETSESSWFGFSIILRETSKLSRAEIIEHLSSRGIETRPIVAGNFIRNEVMKYIPFETYGEFKNADLVHDNGFFVGNSHKDLNTEINFLYKLLLE